MEPIPLDAFPLTQRGQFEKNNAGHIDGLLKAICERGQTEDAECIEAIRRMRLNILNLDHVVAVQQLKSTLEVALQRLDVDCCHEMNKNGPLHQRRNRARNNLYCLERSAPDIEYVRRGGDLLFDGTDSGANTPRRNN